jgi:pimeloyl-ACP methyl ester carboxylesterase
MAREQILNIPTPDNKLIYGKLIDEPTSKPLVIIMHGLTGNHDARIPFNAAWFFADSGFSTYRFSFYFGQNKARDIMDCTLATQAEDLDAVVTHFRKQGVEKIYVIGHSFGGLTILLSKQQDYDKAVLWEPSHPKVNVFKNTIFNKSLGGYVYKSGVDYLISRAMVDHFNGLKIDDYVATRKVPTLIIGGGSSGLAGTNRSYYDALPVDKEFIEIENSDHGFTVEGAQEQVFHKTLHWLKQAS